MSLNRPMDCCGFSKEIQKHLTKLTLFLIISIYISPAMAYFLCLYFEQLTFYFDPYIAGCFDGQGEQENQGEAMLVLALATVIILPCLIEVPLNIFIIWRIFKLQGSSRARTWRAVKTVLMTLLVYYGCWLLDGVGDCFSRHLHSWMVQIRSYTDNQWEQQNVLSELLFHTTVIQRCPSRLHWTL